MRKKRVLTTLSVILALTLSLGFVYFVSAEETTTATQPTAANQNENDAGDDTTASTTSATTVPDWVTATDRQGNTRFPPPPVVTTTTTTTQFVTTAPTRLVTTMVHNPARPSDNLRPPAGRSPVPNFWLMEGGEHVGWDCCEDPNCMLYCCCDDPDCFFYCCCDEAGCQHDCVDNDFADRPLDYVQEDDDPFWNEITGDEHEAGDAGDLEELAPRPGPNMVHVILVAAVLLLAGIGIAAMVVRNKYAQVDEYLEVAETY